MSYSFNQHCLRFIILFTLSYPLESFAQIENHTGTSQDSVFYVSGVKRNICYDKTKEDVMKSIDFFNSIIEKEPLDLESRQSLAMSYYKLGDQNGFKNAIIHWDYIIKADSCYNYALLNRAICKIFIQNKDGACEDLYRAKHCYYPDMSDIDIYLKQFCKKE